MGGFPEPFLKNDARFFGKWARTHQDIIIRQDLLDLEKVTDISTIEHLIDLLSRRVGSTVSYANLAQDLQRDPKTIKRWITYLENLFIIFSIRPFQNKMSRSLVQAPKYYFYNTAAVNGNDGAKFENLVACALLKEIHWQQDAYGARHDLYFLRTKDGKEIDFVLTNNSQPTLMIECKWNDDTLTRQFAYFQKEYPTLPAVQLVGQGITQSRYFPDRHTMVVPAVDWLATFSL